eukprot:GFUD01013297.1.p1 GENE.GFUD01013297.1~~GFUD01013297.1.p1  ORF type:complete len:105 (-),score=38.39 GFUD01013297.1:41-355(-)
MDDAGADMEMDMESMMGDTGGGEGEGTVKAAVVPELTQIEQTTLALQQLGIILSVAFLVSFLFMVMMAVEKVWEQLRGDYKNCKGKSQQEEDPAALVGTFKRYK